MCTCSDTIKTGDLFDKIWNYPHIHQMADNNITDNSSTIFAAKALRNSVYDGSLSLHELCILIL